MPTLQLFNLYSNNWLVVLENYYNFGCNIDIHMFGVHKLGHALLSSKNAPGLDNSGKNYIDSNYMSFLN